MNTKFPFDSISPKSIIGIIKSLGYPLGFTKNTIEIMQQIIKSLPDFNAKLHKNLFDYIIPSLSDEESLRGPKRRFWRISIQRLCGAQLDYIKSLRKFDYISKEIVTKFDGHNLDDYFTGKIGINKSKVNKFRRIIFKNGILAYAICSPINSLSSNIFFAFEYHCKDICSTACLKFALKVASGVPVQHGEVWRCLKNLGSEKDNNHCKLCQARLNCRYDFDFDAMAKLYSVIIQTRMICDYSEELSYKPEFTAFVVGCLFPSCKRVMLESQKQLNKALEGFLFAPITYEETLKNIGLIKKKVYS